MRQHLCIPSFVLVRCVCFHHFTSGRKTSWWSMEILIFNTRVWTQWYFLKQMMLYRRWCNPCERVFFNRRGCIASIRQVQFGNAPFRSYEASNVRGQWPSAVITGFVRLRCGWMLDCFWGRSTLATAGIKVNL